MTWKDPKKWEEMKSGKICPMCSDIPLEENKLSYLIKEFKYSYVRLPKNQHYYGWVIVFLKRHVSELYELEDEERNEYMGEVSRVSEAVGKVFKAVKLHYLSFGSLCPHLHFHIIPRQVEDDPHHAIKMDEAEKFLLDEEYEDILERLRNALGE
ncbi:MAG: HIT family protein [Patescibacteria group bacterium]